MMGTILGEGLIVDRMRKNKIIEKCKKIVVTCFFKEYTN